jgi:glycolate oxidase FAD binding subunit
VQPGVRVADLERLTAGKGQILAFEPPGWTGCSAPAASPPSAGWWPRTCPDRGACGQARRATTCSGFEAVSAAGEMFKAGGKVVKNVTGYDLMKLMAGRGARWRSSPSSP